MPLPLAASHSERGAPGARINRYGSGSVESSSAPVESCRALTCPALHHQSRHLLGRGLLTTGDIGLGLLDARHGLRVGEQLDGGLQRLQILGRDQHHVLTAVAGYVHPSWVGSTSSATSDSRALASDSGIVVIDQNYSLASLDIQGRNLASCEHDRRITISQPKGATVTGDGDDRDAHRDGLQSRVIVRRRY